MGKLTVVAGFLCVLIFLNATGSSLIQIGRPCVIEDDCYDIRLLCVNSTCQCSRFFFWDDGIEECNLNITELRGWLFNLREEIDLSERLNIEATLLFYFISFAGVLAMTLGFVGGLSCIIVFCVLKPKRKSISEPREDPKQVQDDPGAILIPAAAAFELAV